MDKSFLLRAESTVNAIKTKLLLNENIRTLLYYDSENLNSESEVPAIELVSDNIHTKPIISIDTNEKSNQKCFISITCNNQSFLSEIEAAYVVRVAVYVDTTNWIYDNNKIRVYRIGQEIVNILEGLKLDMAGALTYEQMLETNLDKTISGKAFLFSITDGLGDNEN